MQCISLVTAYKQGVLLTWLIEDPSLADRCELALLGDNFTVDVKPIYGDIHPDCLTVEEDLLSMYSFYSTYLNFTVDSDNVSTEDIL